MRLKSLLVVPAIISIAACGSDSTPSDAASEAAPIDAAPSAAPTTVAPTTAEATLKDASGKDVGTATLREEGDGLRLVVQVKEMEPGDHGIHIHTTGKCEGPKFESAGGHWNPGSKMHGLDNPQGAHAGDMANLDVGPTGLDILNEKLSGGTFAQLMDEDGAAVVVHAKRDDQKTDPSGNSGDRIACGVLARG